MKKHLLLVCTILFSFIQSIIFANHIDHEKASISDSLLIQKKNSDKIVVVQSGRKIKVWTNKSQKIKGVFKTIEDNSLVLVTNKNEEVNIAIEEIQKIKVLGKEVKRTLSSFFTTIGVAGIAGGIVFLGIGSQDKSGIGGGIAAGYAAIVGGFGLLHLITGIILSGKKYDLKEKWSISNPLNYTLKTL